MYSEFNSGVFFLSKVSMWTANYSFTLGCPVLCDRSQSICLQTYIPYVAANPLFSRSTQAPDKTKKLSKIIDRHKNKFQARSSSRHTCRHRPNRLRLAPTSPPRHGSSQFKLPIGGRAYRY